MSGHLDRDAILKKILHIFSKSVLLVRWDGAAAIFGDLSEHISNGERALLNRGLAGHGHSHQKGFRIRHSERDPASCDPPAA